MQLARRWYRNLNPRWPSATTVLKQWCSNKSEWDIGEINSEIDRIMGRTVSPDHCENIHFSNSDVNTTNVHAAKKMDDQYDINALNGELEELIGKFEMEDDTSPPLSNLQRTVERPARPPVLNAHVDDAGSRVVDHYTRRILIVYPTIVTRRGSNSVNTFSVNGQSGENVETREVCVLHDDIEVLVSELASGSTEGVVVVREREGYSQEVSNILKIYSRLSPVVLVDSHSTRNKDNMDWARLRISGFTIENGVAAALLGIQAQLKKSRL